MARTRRLAAGAPAGVRGGRVAGRRPGPRLRAAEPGKTEPEAKAKSVIQIFLWGGMSHNDTWDPKPESGREYMGEFSAVIPTNVDGIQIGALFPQLARQADKYSLIRSMTHGNNGHETAAYLMQTGHAPGERLAYPSVGAVFALFKSRGYTGIIPLCRADQAAGAVLRRGLPRGRSTNPLPAAATRTSASKSRALWLEHQHVAAPAAGCRTR